MGSEDVYKRQAYFLQQLINGVTLGSVYGLIAIGYTMVYGIIGMINFAHGDIFMVGAFIALISFILFALTSIALPIVLLLTLLIAMVLIAATFTIKQSIRTNSGYLVIGGVLTGFLLYFISDLITALGFRQSIPIVLAAWAPSGICFLLGLAMVFHLEDG